MRHDIFPRWRIMHQRLLKATDVLFHLLFVQVAYPYVAKRLLTDPNPALRERLIQARYHTPNHGCERMLETRMVIGVHFPSLSFEWDCV